MAENIDYGRYIFHSLRNIEDIRSIAKNGLSSSRWKGVFFSTRNNHKGRCTLVLGLEKTKENIEKYCISGNINAKNDVVIANNYPIDYNDLVIVDCNLFEDVWTEDGMASTWIEQGLPHNTPDEELKGVLLDYFRNPTVYADVYEYFFGEEELNRLKEIGAKFTMLGIQDSTGLQRENRSYNMNKRESELLREAAMVNVVRPLIQNFLSRFMGPSGQRRPDVGNVPSDEPKDAVNRAAYAAKYLMKHAGLKDFQAAACAGVYLDENGCKPSTYMKAEADGKGSSYTQNGGYGAGIGSWTGVQTKNRVLQSVGYDANTKIESLPLNVQCEMVVKEINGHMKKYYDALKRTTNIEDATATAIYITAGPGYVGRAAWETHPTFANAVQTMERLGSANDRRFGYSKHHHGGAERRLSKAKQVLQAMGGSVV